MYLCILLGGDSERFSKEGQSSCEGSVAKPYEQQLRELALLSLEKRRLWGDLKRGFGVVRVLPLLPDNNDRMGGDGLKLL